MEGAVFVIGGWLAKLPFGGEGGVRGNWIEG